jgi:hypothetical protein
MIKTFRLATLNDAIAIAITLTKSWFRGHSRAVGVLTPRISRKPRSCPHDIPAGVKADLLASLRALGVSSRHLFPDLEGLSRMIEFDNRVIAYSPPDPPVCSGEIAQAP